MKLLQRFSARYKKIVSICAVMISLAIIFYSFPQQINVDTGIPKKGVISIAFDDGHQCQYDYAWASLQKHGLTATFYVISGVIRDVSGRKDKMGSKELLELQSMGCEIASHSKTHLDFTKLTEKQIRDECLLSKQELESYGLMVDNFAYPLGLSNSTIDQIVGEYYTSVRYDWGVMQLPHTDLKVTVYSPYSSSGNDLTLLKNKVDEVQQTGGWTIIYFHYIEPEDKGDVWTSQSDFEAFLDYALEKGVTIMTVREALSLGNSRAHYELFQGHHVLVLIMIWILILSTVAELLKRR